MVPGPRAALTNSTKIGSSVMLKQQEPWPMDNACLSHFIFGNSMRGSSPRTRKAKQMLTLHSCSFLKPLQQKARKRGTPSPSLLTTSVWTLGSNPYPSSPVLSYSPWLLRFCLFYQCRTHLTDGPGITWARLPLVKTSVGSPLPKGHTSSSIATLVRMTNSSSINLKATGLKKQTKMFPTDRAGSILTFCKWFPFIKAAHEWLVVVRCTLYLPNTPTAFWTHLIKQIVNMQLVSTYLSVAPAKSQKTAPTLNTSLPLPKPGLLKICWFYLHQKF